MSAFLDRAKSVQSKVAGETRVTIHLDLLEGLIAEIVELTDEVERRRAVSPESVAEIVGRLQPGGDAHQRRQT